MESSSNPASKDDRRDLCGKTLGDYTFLRRIGGGATSDVFLAKQNSLSRNVALKILKDDLAADETYVKRFIHEARAAAKLEHPNVVRIYEVGELVDSEPSKSLWGLAKKRLTPAKAYRFISLEYVAGLSLAQYLRRNGPITVEQTLSVMEQVASALKRASEFNIIHRDVKPENVILDPLGVIHVVDFGLARPIESNDATWTEASITRGGVALGTPLYMSPEQARGQKLDSRSDVYSLGVTAYQMLAGEAPFVGDSPLSVVLKHLNEKPRPVRELRSDVPEELSSLIDRMLSKSPQDRPGSPAELLNEIHEVRLAVSREFATSGAPFVGVDSDPEGKTTDAPSSIGESSNAGSKSGSNPVRIPGASSFFQSEDERELFERSVKTVAVSQEWRTNIARLDSIQNAKERYWTPRRIVLTSLVAGAAFLVGGGVLTYRNARLSAAPPEPPISIQRFNSVEEQYVFAIQTGTIDAWKSVIEYFPEDEYWTKCARRQLALAYAMEKDVDSAEAIFKDLIANPSEGVDFDPFPLAGIAWCAASRGDFDAATATISELSYYRSFDRMADYLLSRTREMIQSRGAASEPFPGGRMSDERMGGGRMNGGAPPRQRERGNNANRPGGFRGGSRGPNGSNGPSGSNRRPPQNGSGGASTPPPRGDGSGDRS